MDKNICNELKNVNNLIFRKFGQILKDSDFHITPMQGKIIFYLMKNRDKQVYQKDIEEFCSSRRSTVSELLKKMEGNGLIVRNLIDSDKRKRIISLTDFALKKQTEIENKVLLLDHSLKKNISDEELALFFAVLEKIKKNI